MSQLDIPYCYRGPMTLPWVALVSSLYRDTYSPSGVIWSNNEEQVVNMLLRHVSMAHPNLRFDNPATLPPDFDMFGMAWMFDDDMPEGVFEIRGGGAAAR